jgi:hypothetical protein
MRESFLLKVLNAKQMEVTLKPLVLAPEHSVVAVDGGL